MTIKTSTTPTSTTFADMVLDHARPMTGGQSWQWTKIADRWLSEESDSTDGLIDAVNAIREQAGFDPLPARGDSWNGPRA